MKKRFLIAEREDGDGKKVKGPTYNQLHDWSHIPSAPGRNMDRTIRYIKLDKNTYQVEVWDTYCPVDRGAFGRQRSVLRAKYTVRRVKEKNNSDKNYMRNFFIGIAERYHWSGGLETRRTYDDTGHELKKVALTPEGKLLAFRDDTRGQFNQRIVEYHYDQGKRRLIRWRDRYTDKTVTSRWGSRGDYTIRKKTEDGSPLLDDGNFMERTYSGTPPFIEKEVRFVGGRKHGPEKTFNRFGRVIGEEYFHHGTNIPGWVYRKPEDVTVEEIIDEDNTEVRRAMLELQGFEVFMQRAQIKGMAKVIDEDPDERIGALIRITLPTERPFNNNPDTTRVMLLRVKDGTLPKHYVLRVPPTMKTARQANAWTWGKKTDEYAPTIER